MKIPKSFNAFGQTFNVQFSNTIWKEDGVLGYWMRDQNLILLAKPNKENGITQSMLEQIFFHEVFHCIFDMLGYKKLNENEQIVDQCGNLLHQILNSFKGELK